MLSYVLFSTFIHKSKHTYVMLSYCGRGALLSANNIRNSFLSFQFRNLKCRKRTFFEILSEIRNPKRQKRGNFEFSSNIRNPKSKKKKKTVRNSETESFEIMGFDFGESK